LGSLAIGVLVAFNDKSLLKAQGSDAGNGAAKSPWVIGKSWAEFLTIKDAANQ